MIVATGIQMGAQSIDMFIGARWAIATVSWPVSLSILMQITHWIWTRFFEKRCPCVAYRACKSYASCIYDLNIPLFVVRRRHHVKTYPNLSIWSDLFLLPSAAWISLWGSTIKTTWAWRMPSTFQAFPAVLQVFFVLIIPESPRWLISQGKDIQALKILAYYHADGDQNDPSVKDEFGKIKAAISLDRTGTRVFNVIVSYLLTLTGSPDAGWASLLSSPGNRKRLCLIIGIAVFSQWSGNGLISYYISQVFDIIGITNPKTQVVNSFPVLAFELCN